MNAVKKSRGRKRKRSDRTEDEMTHTKTQSVVVVKTEKLTTDETSAVGKTTQRSKRKRNNWEKAVVVKPSDLTRTSDSIATMQVCSVESYCYNRYFVFADYSSCWDVDKITSEKVNRNELALNAIIIILKTKNINRACQCLGWG